MIETLQDIAFVCCLSLCCVSFIGFFVITRALRAAGRGYKDLLGGEGGGLFGIDFGDILNLFR